MEACSDSSASDFFKVGEKTISSNSDSMQSEKISLTGANGIALLKVIIEEGHDEFASIHYLDMV